MWSRWNFEQTEYTVTVTVTTHPTSELLRGYGSIDQTERPSKPSNTFSNPKKWKVDAGQSPKDKQTNGKWINLSG